MSLPLLRTALFVPGTRPDRVDKAVATPADTVIIDLEDAVPPEQKAEARQVVRDKLAQYAGPRLIIRCNSFDSGFLEEDLQALAGAGLGFLFLPKVESERDVELIHQALLKLEKQGGQDEGSVHLMCLVETALGVENAFAVTSALARLPRAGVVAFGAADYATDMGIALGATGREIHYPRHRISNASHAAGLAGPIDTPYMYDLKDLETCRADAERAREVGFSGKLCIHPNQIDICNQVFSPTEQEMSFARQVIEAFERTRQGGQGVLQVNGKFIDKPVVERCRRILTLGKAAGISQGG